MPSNFQIDSVAGNWQRSPMSLFTGALVAVALLTAGCDGGGAADEPARAAAGAAADTAAGTAGRAADKAGAAVADTSNETADAKQATAGVADNATANVEAGLLTYQRVSGVSGNLSSTGSDTLANLMTLWTESFKRNYPNVNIQVQAAGSSTAPPALTEGTSNFGPMSRRMKDKEVEAFETKFGYKPTPVRVALDALAVYVHKDNPIESMTIRDVDAVFSVTRRCGGARDLSNWGGIGLAGSWVKRPIQIYGRNSVSGTYGYFKQAALCKGDFKNTVNEQPGSASVVQAVASSLNGIGYSGIGYITSGVRAVPLAENAGEPGIEATSANALSGDYPLARYLWVYVNRRPDSILAPLEAEFLKLVLSREGQEVVAKDGYIPLSARVVTRELKRLGL